MLLRTCLALLFALNPYSYVRGIPPYSVSILESPTAAYLDDFPSSAQLSREQPTYTVRGTVVNSVTGEPIRGALVQASFNVQRSALTGPDGSFQFEGLLAGQGVLTARKPGYYSPADIRNGRFASIQYSPQITVGPDQPPVLLKLVPEGVIYGRISGEGGEPIENLPVHLFIRGVENGRRTPQELPSAITSEEGEFRMADLNPGKYFLFVGPSQTEEFPSTASRGSAPQGYAGAFYAAAPDLASATPVEIAPGTHAEINLSLSLQTFFRITGTFNGFSQNEGVSVQFLNASGQSVGMLSAFDPPKGTFRTMPMPPGSYTITAEAQDPKSQRMFFASRSVNLTSDLSGVHLMLAPGATIPVDVRLEATHRDSPAEQPQIFAQTFGNGKLLSLATNPAPARVVLMSKDRFTQMQFGSDPVGNAPNGPQAIASVPLGAYAVAIYPNGQYYPQSVRSGSIDLLREDLVVAPGTSVQPIQVIMRDDFANLDGKISEDGHPASGSIEVLAIPENAPRQSRSVVTSHPQGLFNLSQLPPGAYKVLAVDRPNELEYTNPEILNKYLSKARDITLLPSQTANVDLELVRLGD
jgi:Carboxypeptidase regulatory-like domain